MRVGHNAEEPLVRQHADAEARVSQLRTRREAERVERDASSEVERLKARQEALQLALDSAGLVQGPNALLVLKVFSEHCSMSSQSIRMGIGD